MRFSWDPAKDEANWRKHGVSFEAAVTVFDDEFLVVQEDRFIDGELRWHALGQSAEHVLLLVVHTVEGEWEDTFRIISARKTEKDERGIYASSFLRARSR